MTLNIYTVQWNQQTDRDVLWHAGLLVEGEQEQEYEREARETGLPIQPMLREGQRLELEPADAEAINRKHPGLLVCDEQPAAGASPAEAKNVYRVMFTAGIDHDVTWLEGEERPLNPLDAQAINALLHRGLLRPVHQTVPEPPMPSPGTPAYQRMQARAHRIAQPQRLYRGDHQGIKG